MMVDGTFVERRGEKIISSDKMVSVTLGKREIGVSAQEDAVITLKTGNVTGLKSTTGIPEPEKQSSRGFNWECNDGITTVKAFPGYYSYMYEDKPLPGAPVENSVLKYYVDGNESKAELTGYIDHDENAILSGSIQLTPGFYTVENINGVMLKAASNGDRILLNANESIVVTGDDPSLKLVSASSVKYKSEKIADHEDLKSKLSAFAEAEKFVSKDGAGGIYNSRKFMSGGAGVNEFNTLGDSMTWELNVPEAGTYDVAIKYVSWSPVLPGVSERMIEVNGVLGLTEIAETGNFGSTPEDWVATRISTKLTLKKGVNKLTIYPISGLWNIDWVGLIKSE